MIAGYDHVSTADNMMGFRKELFVARLSTYERPGSDDMHYELRTYSGLERRKRTHVQLYHWPRVYSNTNSSSLSPETRV